MKKKIISILICTLLIAAAIVIVPEDSNVKAEGGGGGGTYGTVGLDYDFIYNVTKKLSDIIFDENGMDNGIYKGRTFGTEGERHVANVIKWYMENITNNLNVNIVKERIGNESEAYPRQLMKKFNNKIDILGLGLEFREGDSGGPDIVISNNESYVYPRIIVEDEKNVSENIGYCRVRRPSCDDWLHDKVDYYEGLAQNNVSNLNVTYTLLGITGEIIIGEVVHIENYSNATSNETDLFVHLINASDNELNDTLDTLVDHNASGFILMRDNVSNIQNWSTAIPGVAVSVENGSLLKNLTQNNSIFVHPPEDEFPANEAGILKILYYQNNPTSIFYIVLINESGLNLTRWQDYALSFSHASFWEIFMVNGFIRYNPDFSTTHFMNPPTGRQLKDFYSVWPHPIISINGSILVNGQMKDVGEWVDEKQDTEDYVMADLWVYEKKNEQVKSYNVYCDVTGVDQSKTVIVSGGHLDGFWGQSTIDTAVSVATMLGILKYFNDSQITPRFDVRFIAFGGEEWKKRGSWSHVYNSSNDDVLNKVRFMINADVLAHNYQNSPLEIHCLHNITKYFVEELTESTNYDTIFSSENYYLDFITGVVDVTDTYPFLQELPFFPYERIISTINFGKENLTNYHQSGNNHELGDVIDILDQDDLNVSADLYWNVTKAFTTHPDCWFEGTPTHQRWDSPDDDNSWYDTVNVSFTINTSMPQDHVTVRAVLHPRFSLANPDYSILYRYRDKKEFTITPGETQGYINISIPKNAPQEFYQLHVYILNSTGEAILGALEKWGLAGLDDLKSFVGENFDNINIDERLQNFVEEIEDHTGVNVLDISERSEYFHEYQPTWLYILLDLLGIYVFSDDRYQPSKFFLYPPNDPPDRPKKPKGQTFIDAGIEYDYETKTTDPNNDQVEYKWKWSDTDFSDWSDPQNSGVWYEEGHTWTETGYHKIRTRARDIWHSPNVFSLRSFTKRIWVSPSGGFSNENKIIVGESDQYNGITYDLDLPIVNWTWTFPGQQRGESAQHYYTQMVNHTFNFSDNNTVSLKITDSSSVVVYCNKTIGSAYLIADFNVSSTGAQSNVTIDFNSTSLSYYNNITNYNWSFGDGTYNYSQNTSHSYNSSGVYNVTLNITDNESNVDSYYQIIYVESTSPIIISAPCSQYTVGGGQNVTIYADFFDNQSRVKTVKVNITNPDNSSGNFTMYTSTSDYDYEYEFNDTLQIGRYYYHTFVVDNANNSNISAGLNFVVPPIAFVPPTPSSGPINKTYIHVNISSLIEDQHYVFTDFNYDTLLWMRMDDVNATYHPTDLSSYSNNGTKYGDANQTDNGKFGKAFDFDGNGDYIRIPTLDNGGSGYENGEFTLSLWINTNTTGKTITSDYYKSGLGASEKGWNLKINNDKIRYAIANSSSVSNIDGTTNITDGNWTHIVVVDRGETAVTGENTTIYINGNLEKDAARGGKATSSSRQFRIGAYYLFGLGSPDYFNGSIDEVFLFNRSLDLTEIKALYNASADQYNHNFTNLTHNETYNFTGYAADIDGDKNETETRSVTIDTQIPQITNVLDSPDTVGFGFNVTVSADVTDNGSGLNRVELDVTYPDNSSYIYTMDNTVNDTYQYVFSDTWLAGQYNYSIWAYDNASNSNNSPNYSFNVSAQATISIATLKNDYVGNESINITDPPNPPEDYYIVDQGLTWDKYYNHQTGKNILEVSTGPINYQDEYEEWQPINCSLTLLENDSLAYNKGYRTGNERGLYHVYFKPNILDGWPVAFAYNKSTDPATDVLRSELVGMGYVDPSKDWSYEYLENVQSSQAQVDDDSTIYEDVFTGADVVWTYRNTRLKEDIVLSNTTKTMLRSRPPSEYGLSNEDSYLVFITKLDYQGLDMYNASGALTGNFTISEGRIVFKDALGSLQCALPIGDAYELNNESRRNCLTYRIIQHGGEHYLLSGLKLADLNEMTFPIVIDPSLDFISIYYSTPSDGTISKSGSNYNTIWTSSTGTVSDSGDNIRIGQYTFHSYYFIYRGFLFFNTSSLPSNAWIDLANLSLYKKSDLSSTDFDITVQNGQPTFPHDPLQVGDYNKSHYSGNGGSLNTSNFGNGYNNIALTNYSWLTKEGMTKLCVRSSRDISGTAPTGTEYVDVYSNEKGSPYQPKLTIHYRNQSKIKNTGSTNISGYLLIQVQYNDSGNWTVDNDTVNETTPRTINSGNQLALDTIFNGLVNTNDLTNGNGTYRVYAAFRDDEGNILQCDDDTYLVAYWKFTVTF